MRVASLISLCSVHLFTELLSVKTPTHPKSDALKAMSSRPTCVLQCARPKEKQKTRRSTVDFETKQLFTHVFLFLAFKLPRL